MAFDNPARRGLVTELVPEEHIGNAVSLNTATMTGSRMVGPALAALLIARVSAERGPQLASVPWTWT